MNDDLKSISKEGFNSSLLSSFKRIKTIIIYSKIPSKIKIDDMNINYEEDRINQKYDIIGLNYDTSNKEIPYITNKIKRLNIANEYN